MDAEHVTSRGISYSCRGSGPPLLLLHGWCLNRSVWSYQEERLRQDFTVMSLDLPGFGRSSAVAPPSSLDGFASELVEFIRELDLRGAAVAGFAFGAAVAMIAAKNRDFSARALVLVAPPSAAHAPYARMPASMRRDWPEFARRSAKAIVNQPHSDATMLWLEEMFRSTPLATAIDTCRLLESFEPEEHATDVELETLILHGKDDPIVPLQVSERCRQRMRRASLAPVADCGHLAILDQKERTSDLIRTFLSEPR